VAFFNQLQTRPADVSGSDRIAAYLLKNAVAGAGLIQRPYSVRAWAKTIAAMRERDGLTAEAIEGVLLWYAIAIGKSRIPVVCSAKSLRAKWPMLLTAKRIWDEQHPNTKITPEATAIAKRLGRYGWPGGAGNQLTEVVQTSLDNYRAFAKRALALPAPPDWSEGDKRLMRWFLGYMKTRFTAAESFIERYMGEVNRAVANWPGWSGNLRPMAWRPDNKIAARIGRGAAAAACHNPALWDRLVELCRTP
jgi:hypothetical protein